MNLAQGKTAFTDKEHAEIRGLVEAAKNGPPPLTEAQIAREADVAASTLNAYLKGKYAGQNDPVAAALHKWLEARRQQADLRMRFPVAPDFQPLATSAQILGRLHYARAMRRMVVIAGVPGVSKTATARKFCRDTPRSWLATMDPSSGGVLTMLLRILAAAGVTDAKGSPLQLSDRLVARLIEAPALVIIDEAQHLTLQAIEQLRAINDLTRGLGAGVGIVLMGNEASYTKVGPTGAKAELAQISSRIAHRRYIVSPLPEDVAAMARAWADANGEEITQRDIDFLVEVARKPGGLRNVEMTFEGALIACFGNEEPLTLQHLKGAFASITDLNRAA